MEIVTLKAGDEIRRCGQHRSECPIAVIADVADGEVTLVLATEGDLQVMLQNAAAGERQHRKAQRDVLKANRIRKQESHQTRLEKRRATSI